MGFAKGEPRHLCEEDRVSLDSELSDVASDCSSASEIAAKNKRTPSGDGKLLLTLRRGIGSNRPLVPPCMLSNRRTHLDQSIIKVSRSKGERRDAFHGDFGRRRDRRSGTLQPDIAVANPLLNTGISAPYVGKPLLNTGLSAPYIGASTLNIGKSALNLGRSAKYVGNHPLNVGKSAPNVGSYEVLRKRGTWVDAGVPTRREADPGILTQREADAGMPTQSDADAGIPTRRDVDAGIPIWRAADAGIPTRRDADDASKVAGKSFEGRREDDALTIKDDGDSLASRADPKRDPIFATNANANAISVGAKNANANAVGAKNADATANENAINSAGDGITSNAAGDRNAKYSAGDRMASNAEGDRIASNAEGNRNGNNSVGLRNANESAGLRNARKFVGTRNAEGDEGQRANQKAMWTTILVLFLWFLYSFVFAEQKPCISCMFGASSDFEGHPKF